MSDNKDRANRTVADFSSGDDLFRALKSMDVQYSNEPDVNFANPSLQISNSNLYTGIPEDEPMDPSLDWVLENFDKETTEAQTLDEEMKRLMVLKSYLLLDSERQESFERITGLAQRFFKCPMALISLVDLGRQWFLSNRGLGDVRETDRKSAFCAHAIWDTNRLFIVPDATKDFRFKDNPLVTGPPDLRFYAGAPLISPEGYKLGTLCILDRVPRPNGLSPVEQENLLDLASMAVRAAVDHKRVKLQEYEDPTQLIAFTAHDLMTPLTGVQISLSLLSEDKSFRSKTNDAQKDSIHTASECTDVMGRICQTAVSSFRKSQRDDEKKKSKADISSLADTVTSNSLTELKISDFVEKLQTVMASYPKSVPLNISVDESVPPIIISDDLKIFRAAVNYLTSACARTKEGAINFSITLVEKKKKRRILFQCEDTGPNIPKESYPSLFRPFKFDSKAGKDDNPYATLAAGGVSDARISDPALGLYSVATHISSLGGEYGFRSRESSTSNQTETKDSSPTGSRFWFQVPLMLPDSTSKLDGVSPAKIQPLLKPAIIDAERKEVNGSLDNGKTDNKKNATAPTTKASAPNGVVSAIDDSNKRKRKALVIEDSMVVRKSLTRALTKIGFEVTQAVDGMEGLRELQNGLFDVALCDFLMPVMDGLDCVQQYREWEKTHRPFFNQYIIGISAHASGTDIDKGKEVGMDDFKPKPVTYKQLVELSKSETLAAYSDELDSLGKNRMRILSARRLSLVENAQKQVRVCMIAMNRNNPDVDDLEEAAKGRGWKCVIVGNGEEALKLMKLRTWDAILLDEDLPMLPSGQCVARFREWEAMNRVMKQRNVAIVSASCSSMVTDSNAMMQLPFGVDFALGKPIQIREFHFIMLQAEEQSIGFGARDIVAR